MRKRKVACVITSMGDFIQKGDYLEFPSGRHCTVGGHTTFHFNYLNRYQLLWYWLKGFCISSWFDLVDVLVDVKDRINEH